MITMESQGIGLKGTGNARELGGYTGAGGKKVKRGVFLRTGSLTKITEDDINKLTSVYHLDTVFDLRMDEEVMGEKDPEIEGVNNLHLSILDMKSMQQSSEDEIVKYLGNDWQNADPIEMLVAAVKSGMINYDMYIGFLESQSGKDSYRKMFEVIKELPEGRAVLFHCTQGKDRTGLAAMLILAVLGADNETIMRDYMLTNEFNAARIEGEKAIAGKYMSNEDEAELLLMAMDKVSEKTMLNAISFLESKYGSITGYITSGLKVPEDDIKKLRDRFLE